MRSLFVFLFSLSLLFSGIAIAQQRSEGGLSQGFSIGANFSTRGIGAEIAVYTGPLEQQWMFGLTVQGFRDMRENKIEPNQLISNGRPYVYGKVNRALMVTPYFGINRSLMSLGSRNLVNIHGAIMAGPALALLSPYVLEVIKPYQGNLSIIVQEVYNPAEHNYQSIRGRAKGLGNTPGINVRPGISLRGLLQVNLSESTKISALQLAVEGNYFFKPLPIWADAFEGARNQQQFLTFSVGMVFGTRT